MNVETETGYEVTKYEGRGNLEFIAQFLKLKRSIPDLETFHLTDGYLDEDGSKAIRERIQSRPGKISMNDRTRYFDTRRFLESQGLLDDGPSFIERGIYFVDPSTGRSYTVDLARDLLDNKDIEAGRITSFKRIDSEVAFDDMWENPKKLLIDPKYIDAELTITAHYRLVEGAVEMPALGGGITAYCPKDYLWRAEVAERNTQGDRIFKAVNENILDSIKNAEKVFEEDDYVVRSPGASLV